MDSSVERGESKMFTKGQFVEWKGEDENGEFTHNGKVVDYSAVHAIIEISPNGSTVKIPHDDGTLKEIPEPKEWRIALPKKEKEVTTSTSTKRKPHTKSTDGTSKKEKAVAIYQSMIVDGQHPARKDVITRFMAELDMTQAGASTYQNTCKKECSE